ncbi:MAG: hypothetical protein KatS3mg104_1265 [Phycisphaerae bacterium]|jgi:hypothetical protein|nr:MAG: hypothetical protein KatS3mg104_1265 [Phycisphaerae bacterium]
MLDYTKPLVDPGFSMTTREAPRFPGSLRELWATSGFMRAKMYTSRFSVSTQTLRLSAVLFAPTLQIFQ